MRHQLSTLAFISSTILSPVLVFIALFGWAISSAPGSSPDDDFHLASIWCGLGERKGLCELGSTEVSRLVPKPIAESACFVQKPEVSAACWNPYSSGLAEANWLNTTQLYPQGFYANLGLLATPNVEKSVLAMRAINALIATLFLTATFWALPRRLRASLVIPALVTLVPLGMFFIPSTNPSSWAITSALITFPALYGALETVGKRRVSLSILAGAAGFLGSLARTDAGLFSVFAVVLALFISLSNQGWRFRVHSAPTISIMTIIGATAFSFVTSNQGQVAVNGLPLVGGSEPIADTLTILEIGGNAVLIPLLWTSALGLGPLSSLGAFDSPVPLFTGLGSVCVFIIVLRRYWLAQKRIERIAIVSCVAVLWLFPFILLLQANATVGIIVQPRYLLPLIIILSAVASTLPRAESVWNSAERFIGIIAISIANSAALFSSMSRYISGNGSDSLSSSSMWWWTFFMPNPTFVWLTTTLSTVLLGILLVKYSLLPEQSLTTESAD